LDLEQIQAERLDLGQHSADGSSRPVSMVCAP